MRLGNSLGNNRGKKYLRKDEIDIVFATKADHFNEWFDKNYNSLVSFMQSKGFYDEDVFHETYLNIYEKILFSGIEGVDYKPYFMRAIYTNYINTKSSNSEREYRFAELLPNYDRSDEDNDSFNEIEEKSKELVSDCFNYVYSGHDVRDFELFKMYMNLKPAIRYSTLAEITNLKAHNIQRTISKIKKDIRDNKEFANRRKEIL